MIDIQYIDEGDIQDIVEQDCDFYVEDQGLGYYEYGDGKYTDENLQMALTTEEVMVQYTTDTEQLIPTLVQGYTEGYGNDDCDYECGWIAELATVIWNQETRTLDATYQITQD